MQAMTAQRSGSLALPEAPAFPKPSPLGTSRAPRPAIGMLACLDDSASSDAILGHALAVAHALDLPVTAARVLEAPRHLSAPADPLEWQARRRQGLDRLERLVAGSSRATARVERLLLAGPAADELTGWARDHGVGLMALGTGTGQMEAKGLGDTAQRVLERALSSLLLVPPGLTPRLPYRRLLVPLDGSARAESVLPLAVRLARAHGAELVLAHVVPRVEAIGTSASNEPGRALSQRLAEQNEAAARDYLDSLEARLWKEHLPARAVVATGGDPRTELRRLAAELRSDLVILSSHGRSGMNDVACGSVTEYLATHAPAPLLIVRPTFAHDFAGALPSGAEEMRNSSPERA